MSIVIMKAVGTWFVLLIGGSHAAADWFIGVPYAAPPVGNLRFRPPRKPRKWNGIRNATRYGNVCPQALYFEHYASSSLQNEDCLYLNIYAPPISNQSSPKHLHAVMVYIHGGSYRVGGGTPYIGNIISQHDVVVVTLNYRLGILGFLSARHKSLKGNYGLLDQIEALRWVKRNIRAFGGDPNSVTIFGNSAGGSSVGLLLASPMTVGLFSRAIMQSGSPLAFWAVHDNEVDLDTYVRQLASHVACGADRMENIVDCLRTIDWRLLTATACKMPRLLPGGTDCRPVVDGWVLPDLPRTLLSGRVERRPIMAGIVTAEMTRHVWLFLGDLFAKRPELDHELDDGINVETFNAAIDSVMCSTFKYDRAVAEIVRHEYTNWQNQTDPLELRQQYVNLVTDIMMLVPTVEFVDFFARANTPVYMYSFDHYRDPTEWQSRHHELELPYLFGTPFTNVSTDGRLQPTIPYNEGDRQLSALTIRLWTNFAKYGDPSPHQAEPSRQATGSAIVAADESAPQLPAWNRFTPSTPDFLIIDTNSSAVRRYLRADKIQFWMHLIPFVSERFRSEDVVKFPEANVYNNWTEFGGTACYALVVVVILLVLLLVIALFLFARLRRRYCRLLRNGVRPQSLAQ